ncbi:DNA excision repair protein ERCC-8 [Aphelenchoides besseyi]|nr:DNA excision repair protein ERCC-8 [Aphelenchoides besseyi]
MPTCPLYNVVNFWTNRELGLKKPQARRDLIDLRIQTLRDSVKHEVHPWKNRPIGASSLNFDDAEQRFLLCGSCVGEVSIVDMESPAQRKMTTPWRHLTYRAPVSQRHRYLVSGCQFYPVDSGIYVTSSMDQEVKVWDSNCMKVIDKYKNETAVLDCHWGMPNSSGLIAIALGSSCVRLIDPRTRNHIQHMRWKGKFAKCLRWLNSPSHLLLAGSETGNMVLWDIRSGRSELTEVSSNMTTHYNERRAKPTKAHNSCISSIRCSRDGRYVVSLSSDCRIHVWDALTMHLERSINLRDEAEGQCTTSAEISEEGNELYAFVGIEANLVVSRITPKSAQKPAYKPKRQQKVEAEESSSTEEEQKSGRGAVRSCRAAASLRSSTDHRVVHGHMQVIMSTAYRRTYQQLVTSSGDGSTLLWAPQMDEILPDEKHAELNHIYQDDFSDED